MISILSQSDLDMENDDQTRSYLILTNSSIWLDRSLTITDGIFQRLMETPNPQPLHTTP